jgi:DNA-binding transcriptional LysR family regulator
MDLSFLQSLVAVVDSGSIAQAARLQHLTPAALRQRVSALERELGTDLLTRSGHTSQPTQACLELLPRARHMIREWALLKDDIDTFGVCGQLKIGAISTVLTGLMPKALKALALQAPRVTPFLKPGTSADLYAALLSEQLDAVLCVAPPFAPPKSIHTVLLAREPLVMISAKKSALPVKQQFAHDLYIRYDAASWGGRFAQQWIADQRLAPRLLCDLDGLEAIALMVAQGSGISLVPQWSGLHDLGSKLVIKPIAGQKYHRDIVLMVRQPSLQTEKIKLLASLLKEQKSI